MGDIARAIGVTYSTTKIKKKHHKNIHLVQINSDKIFDFCYSLVGSIDKTHIISWPQIPDQFVHHFVRGFFDGDGSIFVKNYKSRHGGAMENLNSSFTASKESWMFLNDLKQYLISKLGVGNKKIVIWKSKNRNDFGSGNSKLVFNQYDTMLLCEWIYKDATIFMKRKKKIWDSFDKEKLKRSQKFFSNKV
jgi:hypothetical protein